MSVAIVIPTHDNEKYLTRCLESLFDLTHTASEYRVTVVDNASTDGTTSYLAGLQGQGCPLRVVKASENHPFAKAVNLGLAFVRDREDVLLLNDDTQITDPLWLGRLTETLSGPGVGAAGPVSNYAAGLQGANLSSQLPSLHEAKLLVGFCMLIKNEAFKKVGLLDERYGHNMFEDFDYSIALSKAGYKLMVDRRVFVLHYGSTTLQRTEEDKSKFNERLVEGQRLLVAKWGLPAWQSASQLPDSLKTWVEENVKPQTPKPKEQTSVPVNGSAWDKAFQVLKPLATDDYVGGAWPKIRYEKHKALFELAGEAKGGAILELGTFRGLGAITLALGTSLPVHTVDDYGDKVGWGGVCYTTRDAQVAMENGARAGVKVTGHNSPILKLASEWHEPLSLIFWDTATDDLSKDMAAWGPHLKAGGIFAVKDRGDLDKDWLYSQPGWTRHKEFPEGLVYTLKKTIGTCLWVITEDHKAEAERSLNRVGNLMPEVALALAMPQERKHPEWFIEQTRVLLDTLRQFPDGERVLWLDSDTYMVKPVPELLEMLDRFDLLLAHAPGHRTAPTLLEIPDAFPEFNVGVMGIRNNELTRELWQWVYASQLEHKEVYGNNDQAPLREALWLNPKGLTYAVLPWEYDCRFTIGTYLRDPVKILHGRTDDYEKVARELDAQTHQVWGDRRYG